MKHDRGLKRLFLGLVYAEAQRDPKWLERMDAISGQMQPTHAQRRLA